jgi:hypothetical protein
MDTVGIHVPTRQIREFSTFSLSGALRHICSARRTIAAIAYADLWTVEAKTMFS